MLSDRAIREALMTGNLGISYHNGLTQDWLNAVGQSRIQPVSVDLTLDEISNQDGYRHVLPYHLKPGEFVLGSTAERVMLGPSLVGTVHGKSTRARQGLSVHSAGLVDPGFRGQLTLEMYNMSGYPVTLDPGMLIAQISFEHISGLVERPYGTYGLNSRYQDQSGPTPAKLS